MNNEEKILNLLEKVYIELQDTKKHLGEKIDNVETELQATKADLKVEIQEVKNTVTKIENEHGQKLNALFDGYKQNSDKLDRIGDEVSKHEEFIIKRIK